MCKLLAVVNGDVISDGLPSLEFLLKIKPSSVQHHV